MSKLLNLLGISSNASEEEIKNKYDEIFGKNPKISYEEFKNIKQEIDGLKDGSEESKLLDEMLTQINANKNNELNSIKSNMDGEQSFFDTLSRHLPHANSWAGWAMLVIALLREIFNPGKVKSHEPQQSNLLNQKSTEQNSSKTNNNQGGGRTKQNQLKPEYEDSSKQGADINIKDADGNTALHLDIKQGNFISAMERIKQGADINIKDADGNTALHLAWLRTGGNDDLIAKMKKTAELRSQVVGKEADEILKQRLENLKKDSPIHPQSDTNQPNTNGGITPSDNLDEGKIEPQLLEQDQKKLMKEIDDLVQQLTQSQSDQMLYQSLENLRKDSPIHPQSDTNQPNTNTVTPQRDNLDKEEEGHNNYAQNTESSSQSSNLVQEKEEQETRMLHQRLENLRGKNNLIHDSTQSQLNSNQSNTNDIPQWSEQSQLEYNIDRGEQHDYYAQNEGASSESDYLELVEKQLKEQLTAIEETQAIEQLGITF